MNDAPKINLWTRLKQSYRQRVKRRALLWRALRSRHALTLVQDNLSNISPDSIIVVCVMRNERLRLPYFLEHYRKLGVDHFLFVDNDGDDGGVEAHLIGQKDVSIWHTASSYRASRFGVDWQNWLLGRYGRRHWCLTVDVDELLIFAEHDAFGLAGLTKWLDARGRHALGALMLEMYPAGSISDIQADPERDPLGQLNWFDADGYRQVRQAGLQNLWVQGGPRDRVFFPDDPDRAPTLNKIPLVKWSWRYAYVNSTHSIRPARLNLVYDGPSGKSPAALLLHTKFLPDITACAQSEQQRGEHFAHPEQYDAYYSQLAEGPKLWYEGSTRYEGWRQLAKLGLIRPSKLN